MNDNACSDNNVRNVFKNGKLPSKEEYTQFWIDMINKIERQKANQ